MTDVPVLMSYVTPGLGRGGTLGGSGWSLAMFIQDSYKVGNAVVLPHTEKNTIFS